MNRMLRLLSLVLTATLAGAFALASASFIAYRAPWRLWLVYPLLALGLAAAVFVGDRIARRRAPLLILFWLLIGAGSFAVLKLHAHSRIPSLWHALDTARPELAGVRDALGDGDVERARGALFDYYRSLPPRFAATFESAPARDAEIADAWLRGEVLLGRGPRFPVPEDIAWSENPAGRVDFPFELHNMSYLSALANRFEATGDERYLTRAEELVFDWIDDNQRDFWRVGPPSPGNSWTDHTTALRLRHWLVFWEAWRRSKRFDAERMETFLAGVLGHLDLLKNEDFYTPEHNHGLDQDISLIATSGVLPELSGAADRLALASRRVEAQIRATIWPSGVHKEHSPAYHLYVMEMLAGVERFAEAHALQPVLQLELASLLDRMAHYLAELALPDLSLPEVGDTRPQERIDREHSPMLDHLAAREPLLRYVLDRNGSTAPPTTLSWFDLEAGYAILRDSWSPQATDRIHLMFNAASNPGRGHKHYDDLSFTLYGLGRPLLVDSGSYQYLYESDGRKYVVSPEAHNTIAVDHGAFLGDDPYAWNWRDPNPAGHATHLESVTDDGEVAVVRASHENWPGIRFERSLVYLRPHRLIVVDRLVPTGAAPQEHQFDQLWHFAPEADVRIEGGESIVRDPKSGEVVLRLSQWKDGRDGGVIVRGERDPMQGWVTTVDTELTPAPVAIHSARGAGALFITTIGIGDAAGPGAGGWARRDDADAVWLESTIGPRAFRLRIPTAGREALSWSVDPG